MDSLRKSTFSKLKAFDDTGWGAREAALNVGAHVPRGKPVGAAAEEETAALLKAMLTEESFPVDGTEPSGEPSVANVLRTGADSPLKFKLARRRREAREVERQQVQMRLRMRGTGLTEIDDENTDPADLTLSSMSTTLRRLPPCGPLLLQAARTQQKCIDLSGDAKRAFDTQQDRPSSVLTSSGKDPAALPKLIDVLSAHRMRDAVPARHKFDVVSSLPQLQAPHQPFSIMSKWDALAGGANKQLPQKTAARRAGMQQSTSLPML